LILAAGGAKGTVSVWDTLSAGGVLSYVQQHAPELAAGRETEAPAAEEQPPPQPQQPGQPPAKQKKTKKKAAA
jgi:hypothetical protein